MTDDELREMATKYATLERIRLSTEREQRAIADALYDAMPRAGYKLSDGTLLVACSQIRKRASLGNVTAFFGPERAQAYWSQVEAKVSTWLSVVLPQEKKA